MHRSLALASLLVALPAAALAQPSATPVAPAAPEAAPPAAEVAAPAAVAAPDPDTDAAVSGPAPIAPAAAAPPSAAPAAPPSAAPVAPARPAAVPFQVVAPVYDAPARRGIAAAQSEDAALHRAYVSGTAVTVPRGAAVVDIRQPLFPAGTLGINVGLTDRWQVSGDLLWVLLFDEEDEGLAYSLGTKLQLIRSDRFALAAHASLMGADDENAVMGGVIASACLDGDCRALLTGHVTALVAGEDLDDLGDDDDCGYDCYDETVEIPVVAGGSLIAGNDTAKVVLELHVAGDDYETGVGAYAGVRFPGRKVSFDVGFIGGAEDDDGAILPLPLFALSGRL
jgi:hypothetical protein